ncbi:MAG TPA: hypothetical protein VIM73_19310 [Polyangiaceae bacterium]
MEPKSPLDALAETMQSALAARRARVEERLRALEDLVLSYRRAVETDVAREFAVEHGFKQPSEASPSAVRAAESLLAAVRALPQLAARNPELESAVNEPTPEQEPAASVRPGAADPKLTGYPTLAQRLADRKLVVIGGLSRRERSSVFPVAIAERCEWVDTEHDGAHAIGNLPQRVRQGRVAAIVILHRAVQHRHTEAVVAAAREADVPIAFAGQGGKASLLRAVEQLEATLARA